VKDGQLRYQSASDPQSYDPPNHIEYLRPLLDGESLQYSFWWESDAVEVHPSIGRTVLRLGPNGASPSWTSLGNDLTGLGYIAADKLDPPPDLLGADNVPTSDAWNQIKMTRRGNVVVFTMNDKPLAEIPITEPPRPGIMRMDDRDVRIRSMTLSGDWPSELPSHLMQPASKTKQK
jgi:hypothetical protein